MAVATLGQFKSSTLNQNGASSWTITMDDPPSAGSLLVAVFGFIGSSHVLKGVAVNNDYTIVMPDSERSVTGLVAAKFAGASESASVTFSMAENTADSASMVLAEFEGDFTAASVSSFLLATGPTTAGDSTLQAIPPLNVATPHLVVPALFISGTSSAPEINLSHNLMAFARPGTANWHRSTALAFRVVESDASHGPTWVWSGAAPSYVGQVGFPLEVTASGFELAAEVRPSVSLQWDDNGDGPFKVVRDDVVVASGLSSPSYVDVGVVAATSYVYAIEDSLDVRTGPVTVNVTAQGGVFFLRRNGSGWSATPA